MSTRTHAAFGMLVIVQAAHSLEEYVGRLWESFPPAYVLTGLVSSDRQFGFLILNTGLVTFGVWCFLWPVRRRWAMASSMMWCWIVLESINGIGHPLWTARQGGYTPGVATAPFLLIGALYLAWQVRREAVSPPKAA